MRESRGGGKCIRLQRSEHLQQIILSRWGVVGTWRLRDWSRMQGTGELYQTSQTAVDKRCFKQELIVYWWQVQCCVSIIITWQSWGLSRQIKVTTSLLCLRQIAL